MPILYPVSIVVKLEATVYTNLNIYFLQDIVTNLRCFIISLQIVFVADLMRTLIG